VTETGVASVVERTRAIAAGAPVVGAHFLGRTAVFVLGEEALLFASADGSERRIAVHGGAILSAAADGDRIVTGGDDGKIVLTEASGEHRIVAGDVKHRWIDHVAIAPDGALAWSAGKTAFVRTTKGEERQLDVATTVGGLAFAPKGFRLAVAHYNGVTLWFPNAAQAAPETLDWKGSHLGVRFSPDGRFLVTTMQELTLHGWRIADRKHMRMSGYAARVQSMDWVAGGDWLATSGADPLILWPFQGKEGPMGKQPRMLAPLPARVAVVACHPREQITAIGYGDGTVLLVRIDDGAEILARRPGAGPISALAWQAGGTMLAFGTEDGEAGLIDLSTGQ
jgi:WD40 repeat protein